MPNIYTSRIKKALALLKESGKPEALVLSSAPQAVRSRDTHHPYRQNSDLFYFTGSHHQELQLVLRPAAREQVVLVAPPYDKVKALWEGTPPSVSALARSLGATVHYSNAPIATLRELLKGTETVYLQSVAGTIGAELRRELAARSSLTLRGLPFRVIEAEHLTSILRCIKDKSEIDAIKASAAITAATLSHVVQYIRGGIREREIAALIDYMYRLHGGEPAFGTIVASGKSAAILHYHELKRTLRKGELLLIDTGCELNMYASDVSRTIPVDGELSPVLHVVYNTVHCAQEAAFKKVKPGTHIKTVYEAAATELTRGLKELGVLKGNVSSLVASGAFKKYFPHGIGHSLGLDVHDVSPEEPNARLGILRPGMVITIEPGLYFDKPVGRVPACGVRIEDDVLVRERGCSILTEEVFPKAIDDVCDLLAP